MNHFLLKDVFHLQRYDLYVVISARDVFSNKRLKLYFLNYLKFKLYYHLFREWHAPFLGSLVHQET